MVLFLCTLLLLVGGAVLLRAWSAASLAEAETQFRQEGRQPASGGGTDDQQKTPATTVERAPTGDGTTLTIADLPEGAAHTAFSRSIRRILPPSSASGAARIWACTSVPASS